MKSKMKTKTKILICASIVAIVIIIQLITSNVGQGTAMRFEQTGVFFPYNFDASPSFYSNSSEFFFFATRDGVAYRTANRDRVEWNHAYSLNRPVMVGRGDFAAVGEQSGGRRIYVFNANEGYLFHVDFDVPVLTFSINETGFLAVVVQYNTGHGIYVFNQASIGGIDGDWMYSRFEEAELVYPTAIEVSADGRYIIVALLDLRVRPTTTLQFGYINSNDGFITGHIQGLFSEERLDRQLVYAMQFMSGNRLVVATTSQLVIYQISPRNHAPSVQEEIWSEALENSLTHIEFYGNSHFVYVLGDRNIGMSDAPPPGTVNIRNAAGARIGTFALGRRATHLSVGHGAVLVGADRNFHAVNFNGTHLWEHNSLFDTRAMLFLDNTDIILIAGMNRAEVQERRRVRVSDFENVWDDED